MAMFFTSDTHYGHQRACNMTVREDGTPQVPFTRPDGVTPLRPFTSVEEMNEELVARWNAKVGPEDHVYHLGDVCMTKRHLPIIGRCNGKKTLVGGNHDTLGSKLYQDYFSEIVGVKEMTKQGFVMTHIPIHESCVERYGVNVHGHLHAVSLPDPRYVCISVEQTDFAPLSLDELLKIIKDRNG